MSNTLSIGDVANLRSGGPAMTVARFEKEDGAPVDGPDLSPHGRDGLVRCIWFDEGGRLQAHAFPHGLLDMASKAAAENSDPSPDRRLKAHVEMERQSAAAARGRGDGEQAQPQVRRRAEPPARPRFALR